MKEVKSALFIINEEIIKLKNNISYLEANNREHYETIDINNERIKDLNVHLKQFQTAQDILIENN